jgi:integrase
MTTPLPRYTPLWATAREAARLICMAESTFREHVASGLLPQGVLIGGKRLYRVAEKRIRAEGFVFHGLRKSAVCKLLEAGCTHKEVAAVTGHSLGQIEHYSKSADQLKLNEAAMRQWERA